MAGRRYIIFKTTRLKRCSVNRGGYGIRSGTPAIVEGVIRGFFLCEGHDGGVGYGMVEHTKTLECLKDEIPLVQNAIRFLSVGIHENKILLGSRSFQIWKVQIVYLVD